MGMNDTQELQMVKAIATLEVMVKEVLTRIDHLETDLKTEFLDIRGEQRVLEERIRQIEKRLAVMTGLAGAAATPGLGALAKMFGVFGG